MIRKSIYAFGATLILTALTIVLWQARYKPERGAFASPGNEPALPGQTPTSGSGHGSPIPSPAGAKRIDETHKQHVRTGLEAIIDGLKKMGAKEVPSTAASLKAAIATGDQKTMLRAFNEAIYGRFAQMSEAIPAIKSMLDSPEPYVRYLAAEALLRVGDPSGIDTLLRLVKSDEVHPYETGDLRFVAAAALSAFNVDGAAESIRGLYSKTKEGELLRSLASLGARATEADSWNYVPSSLAIEHYAKEGSTRFVPQIKETFEQSSDSATKNAAAWAIARMTGEDQYVIYLSEAARPAFSSANQSSFNASTSALRYLGSIQSPHSVRILEEALQSQNPVIVRYAAVNLLFNQSGGSEKAEHFILSELRTSPRMLGTDLAMQIASKLDNPEIRAAAQSFAQRTASDRWRYWGVERANWPVQNWIHDYVVTLNP